MLITYSNTFRKMFARNVMKNRINRRHLTINFDIDLSASGIVVTSGIRALNLVLGVMSLFLSQKHRQFRSRDLRTTRVRKTFLGEVTDREHVVTTGSLR